MARPKNTTPLANQGVRQVSHTAEERDIFFMLALDMFCIANFDNYFLQLNPAWEETLGFSLETLKSKPFIEFIHADVVERNQAGFILTGPDLVSNGHRPKKWQLKRDPFLLETSVPGIFAVGDVRQSAVRRVASAVGQGSTAVSFVHQYLKTV